MGVGLPQRHVPLVVRQLGIGSGVVVYPILPHCRRGHPWTAASTAYNDRGYRTCRICKSDRERARRLRKQRERWGPDGMPENWRFLKKNGPAATRAVDRLWPRVMEVETCWLVTGCDNGLGYGLIYSEGRSVVTHRVMWEHLRGPIPEGLELDHLCRNTNCCNPDHLEPVTHAENLRRAKWGNRKASA